jgi:D-alanyl-D-alanine carboxypeptidase
MCVVRTGAPRWLRGVALVLVTIITVLTVTADPADARRRKKRYNYSPPSASIVIDVNSGKVLQSKQGDARRHPASLTKIMTLYLLFEQLDAGKLKLSSELKVSEHAAAQAPTKLGLDSGDTIDVDDAIKALVTKSANDIAAVVAEAIAGSEKDFAKLMTRKARALGMKHTNYENASGLPDDDQVTTARDQATLARAIQERFPKYYKYFAIRTFTYDGRTMRNHNKLLGRVTGVDGIKTGYTRASGFNLVTSVRRGNRHIVAVVLGGRSSGSRDARMRDLIDEYITVAATTRTATKIADAGETPATPAAKPKEVASANVKTMKLASAAAPHPEPGSTDPIRPLLVKTLTVKPGTTKAATASPFAFVPNQKNAAADKAARDPDKTATVPASPLAEVRVAAIARAPAVAPVESAPAVSAKAQIEPAMTAIKVAEKNDEKAVVTKPAPRKVMHSGWIIQVGAYTDETEAKERLTSAKSHASKLLGDADPFTETFVKDEKTYYRARFAGLDKEKAQAACRYLKRKDFGCFAIRN